MSEVSTFRLYLLRAMYLLIVVGLGVTIWIPMLRHTGRWELMDSVACSLLAGLCATAALGLRYPLQMLPLLLFELVWKSIWMLVIALPLWLADAIDAQTRETINACWMGVILVPLVVPWGYVYRHYVKKPGDRWGRLPPRATPAANAM